MRMEAKKKEEKEERIEKEEKEGRIEEGEKRAEKLRRTRFLSKIIEAAQVLCEEPGRSEV